MKEKQSELTSFGKTVRKKLIDRNMTQVELAGLLGCSKQYLYKILTGRRSGRKYISDIKEILDIKAA